MIVESRLITYKLDFDNITKLKKNIEKVVWSVLVIFAHFFLSSFTSSIPLSRRGETRPKMSIPECSPLNNSLDWLLSTDTDSRRIRGNTQMHLPQRVCCCQRTWWTIFVGFSSFKTNIWHRGPTLHLHFFLHIPVASFFRFDPIRIYCVLPIWLRFLLRFSANLLTPIGVFSQFGTVDNCLVWVGKPSCLMHDTLMLLL